MGIGLFGGLILGLIFVCVSGFSRWDYFNDHKIYDDDKKEEKVE